MEYRDGDCEQSMSPLPPSVLILGPLATSLSEIGSDGVVTPRAWLLLLRGHPGTLAGPESSRK